MPWIVNYLLHFVYPSNIIGIKLVGIKIIGYNINKFEFPANNQDIGIKKI